MEYSFKNLHKCELFNTQYKIKFLGKHINTINADEYFFKTHGLYFVISPNHGWEYCRVEFASEAEVNKKIKSPLNIELIVNKESEFFSSNIFSIIHLKHSGSCIFSEHNYQEKDKLKVTQEEYKPKTLDEILKNAIILDMGESTTDMFIIKKDTEPGGR